jgi:hypothetical protein
MKSFLIGIYQVFIEPIIMTLMVVGGVVVIAALISALFVMLMMWVGVNI